MNKNDLRYIKTESRIINSFKECVNELGFDKTSVALICEKAMISRNTFYVHYKDKYDILDSLFRDVSKKIENSFYENLVRNSKNNDVYAATEWTLNQYEDNQELLYLLFKCSNLKTLSLIESLLMDLPHKYIFPECAKGEKDIKYLLTKSYWLHAVLAFINVWLTNKDKITKKEVVELMIKLNTSPVENLMR